MQLYCWGDTSSGLLDQQTAPSPVATNLTERFINISCGERHTLFLNEKGIVFSSGDNSRGQLGRCWSPTKIFAKVEWLEDVVSIVCGKDHCLALSASGDVFSWGAGDHGQLGLYPKRQQNIFKPSHVRIPLPVKLVQVACGHMHSLALSKGGDVFSWGSNSFGQLGLGKEVSTQGRPVVVCALNGVPVTQISAGGAHSLFLTLSSQVYCCGANENGQLGLNRVDEKGRFNICVVPALRHMYVSFISCGESHTAVLTTQGNVLTFGDGSYGQLGHHSTNNEVKPKIIETLGGPASQIQCGRHHTVVLSFSGQLWAFGRGHKGQLGTGKQGDSLSPILVQRPWTSDRAAAVQNELKISAGWNTNFIYPYDNAKNSGCDQITGRFTETKLQKWMKMRQSNMEVKREIDSMFLTSSSLVGSFTKIITSSFPMEAEALTVDMEVAIRTFDQMVTIPWIKQSINLGFLMDLLTASRTSLKSPEIILVLLSCPLLMEDSNIMNKVVPLAICIANFGEKIQDTLKTWWSCLPASIFTKHIMVFKNSLVFLLLNGLLTTHNASVKCLLDSLKLLYKANKVGQTYKVPLESFYVDAIKTIVHPEDDVALWMSLQDDVNNKTTPVTFCSYPFVFPLACKIAVFYIYVKIKKESCEFVHNISSVGLTGMEEFAGDTSQPVFQLTLRQNHLAGDSFRQLAAASPEAFRRNLLVQFVDDSTIMNVDKKDFFLHVFKELMAPESEMFIYNKTKTLAWFPPKLKVDEKFYFLFGVLCGLAFYNNSVIHLPFPQVLFKKLLSLPPSLDDLKEFEPMLAKCILEDHLPNQGDGSAIPYSVTWCDEKVDLDPKKTEKYLTASNRTKFVAACVDHIFNKSVARVFEFFKTGFYKVCDKKVINIFQPEELQIVIVGLERYSWEVFKRNTVYEGEYHATHPTITTFWKVFDTFTADDKKKFIFFLTGSDQIPFMNMNCIKMTVAVLPNASEEHLPKSHIFGYRLLLPNYKKYPVEKTMQEKLLQAITDTRGV